MANAAAKQRGKIERLEFGPFGHHASRYRRIKGSGSRTESKRPMVPWPGYTAPPGLPTREIAARGHCGAVFLARMRPNRPLEQYESAGDTMRSLKAALLSLAVAAGAALSAAAQDAPPPPPTTYSQDELVNEGNRFFGQVSQGLASIIERAVSQYGLPNGYILGSEGSGALVAGLRYGEGTLSTKNAGQSPVFWQGPTLGPDIGGNGDRVMMLVYNLPSVDAMYRRYGGVQGSAHVIAGFGMTVLAGRQRLCRADHFRRRRPPRPQRRLPQVYRQTDLESLLGHWLSAEFWPKP